MEKKNKLLLLALQYEKGHSRRSRHILSVLGLCEVIADGENLTQEGRENVLTAAILHAIPIR